MSDISHDLWGCFKEGVLKACDKLCGYKKNTKCNVNTWCWNIGVMDEIQKNKEAYKEMTINLTEETKNAYRRLKKVAKKAVARDMKAEAVRKINELSRNPNYVF